MDRGDQVGVAANEAVIPNGGTVLPVAVIVDQHRAAAKVHPASHVGVPHIGEMGDLGPVPDGGIFQLHKVPHLHIPAHMAVGADIGEGTHMGAGLDGALIALGGVDHSAIPHSAVGEYGVGPDLAVLSHHRVPPQNGPWEQQGPRSHRDARLYIDGVRVHHPHAGLQQGLAFCGKIIHKLVTS